MTDITAALAEKPLSDICGAFVDIFRFDETKSTSGNVQFKLRFAGHLGGGTLSIEPPDPNNPIYQGAFIKIYKLEIYWDILEFGAQVYIPPVKVGGFC